MNKRMRKAFTLLELIVVVIVLGILALVAVPAFSGVINNSTDAVVENTAKAVARDANALAAFNSGADVNVTSGANIEDALCELTLDSAWGTTYASDVATISLEKNGEVQSYTISTSGVPARSVVASTTADVAIGTTHTC